MRPRWRRRRPQRRERVLHVVGHSVRRIERCISHALDEIAEHHRPVTAYLRDTLRLLARERDLSVLLPESRNAARVKATATATAPAPPRRAA